MKRLRRVISLVFLIFLTISTYTVSKYSDKRTYVIGVNDLRYKDEEPPTNKKNIDSNQGDAVDETVGYRKQQKKETEAIEISPTLVFKGDIGEQIKKISIEDPGIYAIQLYGGAALESSTDYIAIYLEGPCELEYNSFTEVGVNAQQDGSKDINVIVSLVENDQSLVTLGKTEQEVDETIATKILVNSKLDELLINQGDNEKNEQEKIIVTYLSGITQQEKLKELNQLTK